MTPNQTAISRSNNMTVVRTMKNHLADRMAISTTEGYVIIQYADILYCEAMSNYCRIHLNTSKSHIVSKPLKHLQSVLPSAEFIRTHQSYLVRFDHIVAAGQDVKLSNGSNIPLSRSQRSAFDALLKIRMPIV